MLPVLQALLDQAFSALIWLAIFELWDLYAPPERSRRRELIAWAFLALGMAWVGYRATPI